MIPGSVGAADYLAYPEWLWEGFFVKSDSPQEDLDRLFSHFKNGDGIRVAGCFSGLDMYMLQLRNLFQCLTDHTVNIIGDDALKSVSACDNDSIVQSLLLDLPASVKPGCVFSEIQDRLPASVNCDLHKVYSSVCAEVPKGGLPREQMHNLAENLVDKLIVCLAQVDFKNCMSDCFAHGSKCRTSTLQPEVPPWESRLAARLVATMLPTALALWYSESRSCLS